MASLTVNELLYGYSHGAFPMAEADGMIYWYSPDPRAIIPLERYRPPKSLRPILNKGVFNIKTDTRFEEVMRYCAAPRQGDSSTWISEKIVRGYLDLHHAGLAHSVEAYLKDRLVGGLYGVALGGAFFGESMFYLVSNASKVAFHYLVKILRYNGFILHDAQYMNDNVRRLGAVEIPKEEYVSLLQLALAIKTKFPKAGIIASHSN